MDEERSVLGKQMEVGLGKQRGRKGVGEGKFKSNVSQDLQIQSVNLGNGSIAQEGIKGY